MCWIFPIWLIIYVSIATRTV